MTDKEKLEKLWEDLAKLQLLVRAVKSLMNEWTNMVNLQECIKRIDVKLVYMKEILEEPSIKRG